MGQIVAPFLWQQHTTLKVKKVKPLKTAMNELYD